MSDQPRLEQPTLAGLSVPRRRVRARDAVAEPAATLPVARVTVELSPPHLDRTFEYLVPAGMDEQAQPGVRVKVRFGGQDVDGFLLERVAEPEHDGALVPLRRVVSAEPVLTPTLSRLARAVADHYAGTLSDVLRLAVPARHARTEAEVPAEQGRDESSLPTQVGDVATPTTSAWQAYRSGPALLTRLSRGDGPRAAWAALPCTDGDDIDQRLRAHAGWPQAVAQAVGATLLSGRGALVVVPDSRDVDRVCAALIEAGIPAWEPGQNASSHIRLTADQGPSLRYRAFLAALRGHAPVVVGTRAAAFAPVRNLGLAVCWDDGDDLHAEPRAPYPHVREVLALRAELEGCGLLLAAHSRSVETQALVESGWVREVGADRATVRRNTPRVRALTSVELAREGPAATARLPGPAWRVIRERLAAGPVLVQVPRAGYLPVVACARCRTVARCATCHGPLELSAASADAQCAWCGRLATDWHCDTCENTKFRSVSVGSDRTAEELGRAFPGVTVRLSGARAAAGVLAVVPARSALVVATIGAEPVAEGGYAAAVLLDAAVSTGSTSLRATEEALRRWMAAAALVRPVGEGGQVLLVGDGAERPTQALVRWDPIGLAQRELADRSEVGLPPVIRVAELIGERQAVRAVLSRVQLPEGGDVLGPVPVDDGRTPPVEEPVQLTLTGAEDEVVVRALVRVPVTAGRELARQLAASMAVRSARREPGALRLRLDPREML